MQNKVKAPKAPRQNKKPKLIRPETPKIVKSKPATFQHTYLEQLQQNTQHQINLLQLMLEEQKQIQLAIRKCVMNGFGLLDSNLIIK